MKGYEWERNYRMRPDVSGWVFKDLVSWMIDSLGFDEERRYEVLLQDGTGEGEPIEAARSQVLDSFGEEAWKQWHEFRLSNVWQQHDNFVFHWVRRKDSLMLHWKGTVADRSLCDRIVAETDRRLNAFLAGNEPEHLRAREQERVFGSWLLHPRILEEARKTFLAGEFRQCLLSMEIHLLHRVGQQLQLPKTEYPLAAEFLAAETPRLLLPNLAGKELRQILDGTGKLLLGFQATVRQLLKESERGGTQPDPAQVLKVLVLASLIWERLENGAFNPNAVSKKAKKDGLSKRVAKSPLAKKKPAKRAAQGGKDSGKSGKPGKTSARVFKRKAR